MNGTDHDERETILKAAGELLAERGFAGTTLDQVALRAELRPYSVHSRWRSRSELLVELLRGYAAQPADLPDTGDLESDVVLVLTPVVEAIHRNRVLIGAVAGEAARDPELAGELRLFMLSWQRTARELIARAIEREELPATLDQEWAVDLLSSVVWFRIQLLGDLSLKGVANSLARPVVRAWRAP